MLLDAAARGGLDSPVTCDEQHFDRDGATEAGVSGAVDFAHPPLPSVPVIWSEPSGTRRQGHGSSGGVCSGL